MTMRSVYGIVIAVMFGLVLSGCGRLTLQAYVDPVGVVTGGARTPIVASVADVAIHVEDVPSGFEIERGRARLAEGSPHQLLGYVTLRYRRGGCILMKNYGGSAAEIFAQEVAQAAYAYGGDAVVLYSSEARVGDRPRVLRSTCRQMRWGLDLRENSFARGWIVDLADVEASAP